MAATPRIGLLVFVCGFFILFMCLGFLGFLILDFLELGGLRGGAGRGL